MRVIDPGHVYELWQLGTEEPFRAHFPKRSGGAITYPEEFPGPQTQEYIRMLIDRSQYLDKILPCVETQDAIWHGRMMLWNYEARAYRRKTEEVNRKQPEHDDTERLRSWRRHPAKDVPFNEMDIELRPIGPDGHLLLPELFNRTQY